MPPRYTRPRNDASVEPNGARDGEEDPVPFFAPDQDQDGITNEILCADPEELQLILKTLNANHFNFLHANAVPGVQKIEVQARAQSAVALGGTRLGDAGAEAFVGAGAVSVETIRLVKDADGTVDLSDLR